MQSNPIDQAKLMNDYFSRIVFQNQEVGLEVLRILNVVNDVESLIQYQPQKVMRNPKGKRSIRVDVFVLTNEVVADVEIENNKYRAHPNRTRFNAASMDVYVSEVNMNLKELPKNYVIFICKDDVYKKGYPIYTIRRVVQETGEIYGDDSTIILVNGQYKGDDDIGRLVNDFNCIKASEINNPIIRKEVSYYKDTIEGRKVMEYSISYFRKEGRKEGREEGRKEEKKRLNIEHATRLINEHGWTKEKALSFINVSKKELEMYQKEIEARLQS